MVSLTVTDAQLAQRSATYVRESYLRAMVAVRLELTTLSRTRAHHASARNSSTRRTCRLSSRAAAFQLPAALWLAQGLSPAYDRRRRALVRASHSR